VAAKPATAPTTDALDAAAHDAAMMAVLADSNGAATGMETKKGLSSSDLWLLDGV
jgi:hypothetical protein